MKFEVKVQTEVALSARTQQVSGMFDLPPTKRVDLQWVADLPLESKPWNVGLVVGPSGCGKSTVARVAFKDELARFEELTASMRASGNRSLLDTFPESMGTKDVVTLLSSVGFSSPPAWLRPFNVLSNGEQFRVMMARALAEGMQDPERITVVDEYTSVVDRTVAQIGSSALAKAVRRNGQRFVAVTCHEDVEAWLQPDWVYRPAEQSFAWRSVQPRPRVDLTIYRVKPSLWSRFRHHHYLTHELNQSAFCFAAVANFPGFGERLVAFDAWLPFFGRVKGDRKMRRGHRTVCLPDYQGIGIGNALFSTLASMWVGLGFRAVSGTAHPAEIAARKRNPNWRMTRAPGFTAKGNHTIDAKRASDRLMASFEWVGPGMDPTQAQRLLSNWTTRYG